MTQIGFGSPLVSLSLTTTSFMPDTGNAGIYADRSLARFGYFEVIKL